jgi:hypothetical protein
MKTEFMIVRHSRKEQPMRVSIEKSTYDLTNYTYIGMSVATPTMAEWVWTEDLAVYQKSYQKHIKLE